MMKRVMTLIFTAFFGAACLNAAMISTAFDDDEIIEEIVIKGNETVEERFIMQKISYVTGTVYSMYKTREDIKTLYSTGRFEDIRFSMDKIDGKTVLVIEVSEKPLVNKIFVRGNTDISDGDIKNKLSEKDEAPSVSREEPETEDELDKMDIIKERGYFDDYKMRRALERVEKLYRDKNYYYAKIDYEIKEIEKEEGGKKKKMADITVVVDEGDKMKVKQITASGNRAFGIDKIKGVMETKEEGWFQSGVFNDEKFVSDLKKILVLYYEEGYVKAKINGYSFGEIDINAKKIVEEFVSFERAANAININIPVNEGIRYMVKELSVSGMQKYSDEEILEAMELKPERPFNRVQFERDVASVRNLYAGSGYIFSQIKENFVYDDDIGNVIIALEITEGPIAYVNEIKIRGNYVTLEKVIRREIPIVEGQPFDSNRIRKAQEKIYNLGFFDNVVIDTEQVDMDRLNLVFEVTERKTGNIGLGAGFSTVEGLVGYVQLSQSNLFGEGKAFSADVQFGSDKQSWQLSYKDPWLFDTATSFGADLWNVYKRNSYNNQGYDLDTYGFNLSFGRRFGDEHRAFLTYRYQEDKYSNIDPVLAGIVGEGKSQISSITPMYVYDDRDDVFDPSRGVYASFSMQLGGGWLGGDFNYIKTVADVRYFVPSIWRTALALHAKVGSGTAYNYSYGNAALPVTEKFYCGGTDTVRGYEERALGPLGGGDFLMVFNAEYKIKLVERTLTAAVFYDSGNCWANADEVDWTNPFLYSAVGAGIRLTIPGTVMVLRLDYGYGLVPSKAAKGGKIHFNIGNIF